MGISIIDNDADESAALSPSTRESAHLVQFYEADSFLLEALSRLVGDSLVAGDSGVVIATRAHRDGLEEELRRRGLDLDALRSQGRYVALDAAGTLASFMVDDFPDEDCFRHVRAEGIKRAIENSESRHACAYGEMVALLFADGKGDALLRLEELWNALGRELRFSLCCCFPNTPFCNRSAA